MSQLLNITFRERLAEAIANYSGSFVGLCNRAGYSTSYVRRVMDGERINPTLSFVECMAGALNIDPLKLLK